jgi:serine/threonine protein phosphatase 1
MRTYIVADIHGEYDKLMACLQAVNFDYEYDRLIQLGDVVDRGPKSYEVVEELLKIKNLVAIRGNHDATWRDALLKEDPLANVLYEQGGRQTYQSYLNNCHETSDGRVVVPISHFNFFVNKQINYYVDEVGNLFVHGGFNRHEHIAEQPEQILNWDRDLFMAYRGYLSMKNDKHPFKIKDKFNHIYIGHTPTQYFGSDEPLMYPLITNLDTGSGKGGKLTIMDLETKEFKQF